MFLAIKADFLLRSRNFAASASVSHFDAAPNDSLVPKLVLNNTHGVSPIPPDVVETYVDDAADTASADAAAVHANSMDVVPDPDSYIDEDAIYLSTGDTAIFPYTILYLMVQGKIAVSPVHR